MSQDTICQFAQKLESINELQITCYVDAENQWQSMLMFLHYLKDILIKNDTRVTVELGVKDYHMDDHERAGTEIISTQGVLDIANGIGKIECKYCVDISLDSKNIPEESISTVVKYYLSNKSVVNNVECICISCDVLSIFDVLFCQQVSPNKHKQEINKNGNLLQVDLMKYKNLKYLGLNVNPTCSGVESFDLIINCLTFIYNYHCIHPHDHVACEMTLSIAIDKPLSTFKDELKELFELVGYKFSESRIGISLWIQIYYKFFDNDFWEYTEYEDGSKEKKEKQKKFKQYCKVLRQDYEKYYHEIFESIFDYKVREKFSNPVTNEYCPPTLLQYDLTFECGLNLSDEEETPELSDVILTITIANS